MKKEKLNAPIYQTVSQKTKFEYTDPISELVISVNSACGEDLKIKLKDMGGRKREIHITHSEFLIIRQLVKKLSKSFNPLPNEQQRMV